MKNNKLNLILLAILAMALFATACEDTKKIEAANKFVDSANKKSEEVKALVTKATDAFDKFTKDESDFEESKKTHEAALKEAITNYTKVTELQKSAAADFTAAAKGNSNEKFKAYYETSAKDMEKSAEIVNQSKEMAQAVLDSKDVETFTKKSDAIKSKADSLTKESDAIREKLKKLEAEVNALNK